MKIKYTNLTVFVVFFGLPLVEAVKVKNWLEIGIFGLLGVMCWYADAKLNSWPWRR